MAGVRYFAKPGSRSTAPNINLLYELKDDIMHDMWGNTKQKHTIFSRFASKVTPRNAGCISK